MVIAAFILIVLLLAFYYLQPNPTLAFGLGLVAAIATGILVPLIVFELQSPRFVVWSAEDQWDGTSRWKFIHVVVRNIAGSFMGGGAAGGVRGEIRVDDQKQVYTTKWVSKSEPFHEQYLPAAAPAQSGAQAYTIISRIDPGLIEEAKIQTINPQDEHVLDIAVKVSGDPRCFIHEPENYGEPDHKKNPFGPGEHHLSLTLRWGTRSDGPFEFILVNGDGTSPGSLSLRAARQDDPRTQRPSPKTS